ncbi:MAG: rod shape-determining protein [Fibrobacteria bacterium]|nr:rod shape-determining protein [Fibrobacteria bacterium]
MFGLLSNDIGIDLGTANTLVHVSGKGIVINEPSVVAADRRTGKIIAIGSEAKQMLGRTPDDIIAVRPMKDGVIADFKSVESLLTKMIKKVQKYPLFLLRPRIVVGVPSGITEVEKMAVIDASQRAGAREVHLVAEPMAAAIGMGIPVEDASGNMIIDIGGGTSEIAVIALYGIVCDANLRVGGDEMDVAIVDYLKKAHNMLIGESTAEQIKMTIGSAFPLKEELVMEVKGRDLIAGVPKTMTLTSEEIREALAETIGLIVDAVRKALENTPPELSSDIVDKGIVMTGGGSKVRGLDDRLREETNLPVNVIDDPMVCVCKGTARILEDIDKFRKVLMAATH